MNNNSWGGSTIGTNYRGNRAQSPVNITYNAADPGIYDTQNVVIGDEWVNTTSGDVFKLVDLSQTSSSQGFALANWQLFIGSSGGNIEDINTDSGIATPSVGTIFLLGGTNINTSASSDIINVNLDNTVSVSGSITAGTGLTASTGDIQAVSGDILASGDITTVSGQVIGDTVTGLNGVSALAGNVSAALGNVSANGTVTAGTGISTSTGNVTIVAGNLSLPSTSAAGDAGMIYLNGDRFISSRGTRNLFVGILSGNTSLTGTDNVGIGNGVLDDVTSSIGNVGVGSIALSALTSGGGFNTCVGDGSLFQLVTGALNTCVGYSAGSSYTGAESRNIIIGNKTGTVGESNTTRIGNTGSTTSCFIDGISGVSVANTNMVTINTVTGQLGSATVPNGSLLSTTVSLTNSQVKNLHATPITIIAAQGAGTTIWVISVIAKLVYGGTNAFTNAGGNPITFFFTDNSGASVTATVLPSAAITATSSQTFYNSAGTTVFTASAAVENLPLVASGTAATEIAGNAANDNTVSISVIYKVVTL